MRCLVTGGGGFIGSHLVDKLLEENHEVIVIDNAPKYLNRYARYYEHSITDVKNVEHLYSGIDYVFHLAAITKIQQSILEPCETFYNNALGTNIVLECSRNAGVKRVVFSSTAAAYGNNSIPNHEEQAEDPLNPYSISKVSGEKLCKMYNDLYGLETIIFRYFNVFGERQPSSGHYAPVIAIFLDQLKKGGPLTVVGDGTQSRDFVYVGDVVSANILAATSNIKKDDLGKVYNVGTGRTYTVLEIARTVSDNIVYLPPRVGECKKSVASIERIKSVFGWEPRGDIMEWIKNKS